MSAAIPNASGRAIETEYKGCLFRSRLEARWAVFFDAAEIPWQYECEGFEKTDGVGGVTRYLPDFFLPATKTWVEVKGSDEALLAEWKRIAWMLDYASPIPGITDSYQRDESGLLLLGEIPHVETGFVAHPLIQHQKGLIRTWATFGPVHGPWRIGFRHRSFVHESLGIPEDAVGFESAEPSLHPLVITASRSYAKVRAAYRTARAARFEHGQAPRCAPERRSPVPVGRGSLATQALVRLLHSPQLAAEVTDSDRAQLNASDEPGIALLLEVLDELRARPAQSSSEVVRRWGRDTGQALQKLLDHDCRYLAQVHRLNPSAPAQELRAALTALCKGVAARRLAELEQLSRRGSLSGEQAQEFARLVEDLSVRGSPP